MTRFPILKILSLFFIWKVYLYLIALISLYLGHQPLGNALVNVWTNWDGRHFISLAQNGYQTNFQFAFFPLYPALIKAFGSILGNYNFAAILISNLSLVGFLILFYRYISRGWGDLVAWRSLTLLLFFPTSFYLNSAYSESFYLFLTMLSLYFADTNRWTRSWMSAMLTSLTRFSGILNNFLIVALYLRRKPNPKALLVLLLSFSGLLLYMLYLNLNFHNPVWFIDAQTHWQRQANLTNPIETFINYPNYLLPNGVPVYSIYLDYLFTILFLILPIFVYRRIDRLLGIYSGLIILLPFLSGSMQSMPRYALSSWPVFILLGIWGTNRRFELIYLTISLVGLTIITGLFVNNYWVA